MKKPAAAPVALVTGSASGPGRDIAVGLAGVCGAVIVHCRRDVRGADRTRALVSAGGTESAVLRADLAREKSAIALIRRIERRWGRLDILVNNVGPFLQKPWDRLTTADWERTMRTNLFGSYACLKAALPGMRRRGRGRIVNIGFGRVEHLVAFPGILPYAAAKTGLLLLTRTAAAAEAGSGITVNMVSPGLLRGGTLPSGTSVRDETVGTFADVAAAVRFLVSDEAARISGTNLIVAGTWKM